MCQFNSIEYVYANLNGERRMKLTEIFCVIARLIDK